MARDEAAVRARLDYVSSRLGSPQGTPVPQATEEWDHDEEPGDWLYDESDPNEASELTDDAGSETTEFEPVSEASEAALLDEWLPETMIRRLPEGLHEPDYEENPANPAWARPEDSELDDPQPEPTPPMASFAGLLSEPALSSHTWRSDRQPPTTSGESPSQPRWMAIAEAALDPGPISPQRASAEEFSAGPLSNRVPPGEFSASQWAPDPPETRSPLVSTEEWSSPDLTPAVDRPEAEPIEVEPLAVEATEELSEWRPELAERPAEKSEPPEAARYGPEAWQPPLEQQPTPVEPTHNDPLVWQPMPAAPSEPESMPAADPSRWAPVSAPVRVGNGGQDPSSTAGRWLPDVLETHQEAAEPRTEEDASLISTSASEWLPDELARAERRVRPRGRR